MTTENKGCLPTILQAFGLNTQPTPLAEATPETLPYRLRDDFLSRAEQNFFHVLQKAVDGRWLIFTKVSLGDLFYAQSGNRAQNQSYRNKINRKHVDFLLCRPDTLRPVLGIELDDASHQRADRQARDAFVEDIFAAAELPLFRQPVRQTYAVRELAESLAAMVDEPHTEAKKPIAPSPSHAKPSVENPISAPFCPKCGQPMVLRVVKKDGPHKGKKFWGCKDFPKCRGVLEYGK